MEKHITGTVRHLDEADKDRLRRIADDAAAEQDKRLLAKSLLEVNQGVCDLSSILKAIADSGVLQVRPQ